MSVITALLTAAVMGGLFYGAMDPWALGALCVLAGCVIGLLGRHSHRGVLSIDALAQSSRFLNVNAALKTGSCLLMLLLCLISRAQTGLFLTAALLALTVWGGGIRLSDYLHLLALPVSFVLLSSLALLFDWSAAASGVISLPFGSAWLCITETAQVHTRLILCRALGALSCLYLLSLSTPISEIIGVLRRIHVPAVILDLMYLIYRYSFLMLETHRTMHNSAESRLGYVDFRQSLRTTGTLYANLLARSYRKANACFDAMESRCYDGNLQFLEEKRPVTASSVFVTGGIFLAALAIALWR